MQRERDNTRLIHFFDIPSELFLKVTGLPNEDEIVSENEDFDKVRTLYRVCRYTRRLIVKKITSIQIPLFVPLYKDFFIANLSNLNSLCFRPKEIYKYLEDDDIKQLTNLTALEIPDTKSLSWSVLKTFTKLKVLTLSPENCTTVLSKHLNKMTNLETLMIKTSFAYNNDALVNLTKLKSLSIPEDDGCFSNDGLKHLTNLVRLKLHSAIPVKGVYKNYLRIDDDLFKHLTNLKSLNIGHMKNITEKGLKHLTKLDTLTISTRSRIKMKSLHKHMTKNDCLLVRRINKKERVKELCVIKYGQLINHLIW